MLDMYLVVKEVILFVKVVVVEGAVLVEVVAINVD